MKLLAYSLLTLGLSVSFNSHAASIYAGKAKAAAVCSQCHSIRNHNASSPIPPLAGRNEEYMEMALKQYRDKTRRSAIMNNIASGLSDRDINNIASYYNRLKP